MAEERVKMVVHNLPWNLTEDKFLEALGNANKHVTYFDYVHGKLTASRRESSHAILGFQSHDDLLQCVRMLNGRMFVDSKGRQQTCIVEYAAFQDLPRQSSGDPSKNTVEKSPGFVKFCEELKTPIVRAVSAEKQYEEREKAELAKTGQGKEVHMSPILEELRNIHRLKRDKRNTPKTLRNISNVGSPKGEVDKLRNSLSSQDMPPFKILYVLPNVSKKGIIPVPADKIAPTRGVFSCLSDLSHNAPSRSVCIPFVNGTCSFGSECRQIHVDPKYWAEVEESDYMSPIRHSEAEGEIHVIWNERGESHGPFILPATIVYITRGSESFLSEMKRKGKAEERELCMLFLKGFCAARYQCTHIHVDREDWQKHLHFGKTVDPQSLPSTAYKSPLSPMAACGSGHTTA